MTAVIENDTLKITEGSTAIYRVNIVDENEAPVLLSEINSITLTYIDDETGAVINGRNSQNVLNANDCEMGVSDGLFTWNLRTEDSAVLDSNLRFETHVANITITWDTDKTKRHSFYIQSENVGRGCWQNFVNRVALRVGAGRRTIELTDDHWCEAVSQTMDLLNTYLYRPVWSVLLAQAGTNLVVKFNDQAGAPATFDPNLQSIVRVMFKDPNVGGLPGSDDPFLLTNRIIGGSGFSGGYGGREGRMAPAGRTGLGDIAFWKQHNEAADRLLSNDNDWLWDETNRQLVLSMPNEGPWDITYIMSYAYTPNNLPAGYNNYFLQALEGYARIMLADIRGKYGSQIPGPTGGVEIDADKQLQRGQDLIQRVEETMQSLPLQAVPEFG